MFMWVKAPIWTWLPKYASMPEYSDKESSTRRKLSLKIDFFAIIYA